jgi:ribosomal protein S18 acetylase RimI-like enzyme
VVPEHRSRGIGTAMLRSVEDALRERGGDRLEINVDGEDTDARRFYERHGYTCQGPDEPAPDLCYSRELG